MKISVSLMPQARADAVALVNQQFNEIATRQIQRDAAHSAKRVVAAAVLSGAEAPAEFTAEANLRGVDVSVLAADIAAKPNDAAIRELDRQRKIHAIESVSSAAELKDLI
jgi:hypothetical protein